MAERTVVITYSDAYDKAVIREAARLNVEPEEALAAAAMEYARSLAGQLRRTVLEAAPNVIDKATDAEIALFLAKFEEINNR